MAINENDVLSIFGDKYVEVTSEEEFKRFYTTVGLQDTIFFDGENKDELGKIDEISTQAVGGVRTTVYRMRARPTNISDFKSLRPIFRKPMIVTHLGLGYKLGVTTTNKDNQNEQKAVLDYTILTKLREKQKEKQIYLYAAKRKQGDETVSADEYFSVSLKVETELKGFSSLIKSPISIFINPLGEKYTDLTASLKNRKNALDALGKPEVVVKENKVTNEEDKVWLKNFLETSATKADAELKKDIENRKKEIDTEAKGFGKSITLSELQQSYVLIINKTDITEDFKVLLKPGNSNVDNVSEPVTVPGNVAEKQNTIFSGLFGGRRKTNKNKKKYISTYKKSNKKSCKGKSKKQNKSRKVFFF